jgi:RNA recognition motif-containing protein
MSTKLYVGNLPYEASESDLQALFEGAGGVASVSIVRDRATGQARGFAFVEMNDDDGARRAITELDKREFGGRSLTVNEARPMAPRGDGGGGGFNRGGGGSNRGRQPRQSRW